MTTEERLEALEREVARLREKPPTFGYFRKASQRCRDYYDSVKATGQDFGALMGCEDVARKVLREKYGTKDKKTPARYIDTEEKGQEYYEVFLDFLAVYQRHYKGESNT